MRLPFTFCVLVIALGPSVARADVPEVTWQAASAPCASGVVAADDDGRAYSVCRDSQADGLRIETLDAAGRVLARVSVDAGQLARPADAAWSEGRLVITGQARGKDGADLAVLALETPSLDLAWSAQYGGDDFDAGQAIAFAPDGDVVVSGVGRARDLDVLVLRFAPDDGASRWVARFDTRFDDSATFEREGLAIDGEGSAYVISSRMLAKFDPQGRELWRRRVDAAAVRLDERGRPIVTAPGHTARFDRDGALEWESAIGGTALAIDGEGGATTTRSVIDSEGVSDVEIAALDASGGPRFVVRYNGGGQETSTAIALEPGGDAVVFAGIDQRPAALGIDRAGTIQCVVRWSDGTAPHDVARTTDGHWVVSGSNGVIALRERAPTASGCTAARGERAPWSALVVVAGVAVVVRRRPRPRGEG